MNKLFIILLLNTFFVSAQTPQHIHYAYDALNRLTEASYPTGSKITYHYDELGNRTSVVTSYCPPPTATLSGTQTITAGQNATLSLALTGTAPWSVTVNGVAYPGITSSPHSVVVTPVVPTTYTLSAVSTSCGVGTYSGEAVVTVVPPPAPVIAAGGPTTFCAGSSVSLSAGTFSGYVWKKDGTSVGTNASYSATQSGSYTVTVTDGNGFQVTSPPLSVTVNPLPVVSLSALAASYCQNASPSTPGTPAGGNYAIDGGSPVASFNPASLSIGPHNVVYTYTDGNSCRNSASQTVSVLQPQFTSPASVSGGPVCAGTPVMLSFGVNCPTNATFVAELTTAAGVPVGISLGSVTPGSQAVTIPAGTPTGNYKIQVTGSNPTMTSLSGVFGVTGLSANFNSTATVSLVPACAGTSIRVTFTQGAAPACSFPLGNVFSAELSDATGNFATPVSLGSVNPGLNTLTIPQNTPSGSGYRVRIAATTNGSSAYSTQSAAFMVNAPAFAGTPTVSADNKCAGEAVRLSFSLNGCAFPAGNTFTAELSNATGSFAAPVNVGTVTPGGLNNVTIPLGTPAGTSYKLRIVSSNPVEISAASANFKVKACTAGREVAPEELAGLRVVVSPNPSPGGRLKISISGAEGQALRVALFNSLGQSLRESAIERASEEEILTWDISRQAQGLYLLRVSGAKETKTVKILH